MTVYLDTNVIIYVVERNPTWAPRASARLGALQTAGATLMISDLARMECLVGPLRSGDLALQSDCRAFFGAAGVQVVPIPGAVCDRAAVIRATTRFKPLDALHLAAEVEHGAGVFLT